MTEPSPPVTERRSTSRLLRMALRLLPLLVLAGALGLAVIFMSTRPTARHNTAGPKKSQARLVTVTPAEPAPATLMISANGTVEAAQSTALRPRVSGQLIALDDDLAPGTRFEKDDVLARIDPEDYKLSLEQARTALAKARAALDTEDGQQAVAKRELALVGADNVSDKERNLALRGPQLASAKADVQSAASQLDQAKLDLARTRVKAPFDGIVTQRSASVGDVVSSSDTLATLAATQAYWVNLSLPVDQLRWLHAAESSDDQGSAARIYYPDAWGENAWLAGHVLRIQAQLEAQGRLARVLVSVAHPLGADSNDHQALLLGAYVTAHLAARMPAHSVVIDSAFVRENNQVWVMTDDGQLDIRKVHVAYRDNTRAVIDHGLAAGDEVVSSDLSAPIQGMPIRVDQPAEQRQSTPSRDATAGDDATASAATRGSAPRSATGLRMAPAHTALAVDQTSRAS